MTIRDDLIAKLKAMRAPPDQALEDAILLAESLPVEPEPEPDDPIDPEPDDPVEPDDPIDLEPDDPVDPEPDDPDLPPIEPSGDLWSDPATWPDGIPTAETDVVIHGEMVIDGEAHCRKLTIQHHSIVTLTGHLHAHGSVIVEDGALLQGTVGTISFYVPDDRVFQGAHGHMPTPEDTGLWCMTGGQIDFRGNYVTPWRSTIPSAAGEKSLKYGVTTRKTMVPGQWDDPDPSVEEPGLVSLDGGSPTGWKDGDQLLLTSEHGWAKLARQVHRHAYHVNHDAGSFAGGDIRFGGVVKGSAKVANLSRSIVIESALCVPGDTNHRAHTIALRGANVHFENVAFRNLGPRGKLGLYPIHIHHGLDQTPAVVKGCAIYQDCGAPGNRWAVIHDSENVQLVDNVGYNSHGHGFFMEAGTERGCTVIGNLGVHAEGKEEIPVFSPSSTSRVALAHAFWTWAGNTVSGNVSVTKTGIGLVMFGQAAPGATIPPQGVVDGHEHYGGYSGAWVSMGGKINGLRSFNADFGTFPGTPGDFQWFDNAFIYGKVGLSGYAYPGHRVSNSVILADTLVSTHGGTMVEIADSVLRCEFMTLHELLKISVIFKRCDIQAARGVMEKVIFQDKLQYYSLIRVEDCTAVIAGEQITTADFVNRGSHAVYGFEGSDFGEGITRKLDQRAPVPGFVVTPEKGQARYTPVGHEPKVAGDVKAMGLQVASESRIQASKEMGLDGYWGGLPPGPWLIEVLAGGTVVHSEEINVQAGEIYTIDTGL